LRGAGQIASHHATASHKKKGVVMEKKIKDDEDVRRKGVGLPLILALLFIVLFGLALAGCT
jgi:hypothetical protein